MPRAIVYLLKIVLSGKLSDATAELVLIIVYFLPKGILATVLRL